MRVEEIDGLGLVKRLAEDMEEMFHKKAQAMKVLVSTWLFIHHTKIQNGPYKSTRKCKDSSVIKYADHSEPIGCLEKCCSVTLPQ